MDLNGEEKRIQALFHELKAEDGYFTPPFIEMWSAAYVRVGHVERRRGLLKGLFTFPRLVVAVLLMACVIAAITPWFGQPDWLAQDISPLQLPNDRESDLNHQVRPIADVLDIQKPTSQKRNDSVIRVRRSAGRKGVAISRLQRVKETKLSLWRSPTAGLLRFPGDELLKNSPAVNQSTQEMRGFLSNLN